MPRQSRQANAFSLPVVLQVQRHSVKRMVSQLEGMVGIGSPIAHDSNWQMSNR